jgi:peptidoglycan/xylan/chitin deacetylase (PgdA/CDA1 family)
VRINPKSGALFALAAAIAVGGSFLLPLSDPAGEAHAEASAPSRQDSQLVAEQIAEYCQGGVPPEAPTVPARGGEPVPVFIYHRVTDADPPSREVISPARFREHLELLRRLGYRTATASALAEHMLGRAALPEKTVLLTFDDGWKDNVQAAAVLREFEMSGTFYVISGFFGNRMYVSEGDVRELAANPNFEIGSHTHSHFVQWEKRLGELDLCTMAGEMALSRIILGRLAGAPVRSIAWPYGYNTRQAIHVASALGYSSTMMVNRDSDNEPGMSPLFTRRMNVDGNCPLDAFREMLETKKLRECP